MSCDAVILCGGLGTRLKSVIGERQKTMTPVSDKPFLRLLVDYLGRSGVRRAILCAGHDAQSVLDYFGDRKLGVEVVISKENQPMGTGGALKLAENLIQSNRFLVLNGDSYCAADLRALTAFHQAHRAAVSVVARRADERRDGGYLRVDSEGRVLAFNEKRFEPEYLLSAGIYLFDRTVLQRIPENRPSSLEKDLFPQLVPQNMRAFVTDAALYDIGTPERLEAFQKQFEEGRFS